MATYLKEELKNKVAADWFAAYDCTQIVADASLYDIRLHFQGVNDKGNMNPGSEDTQYNQLRGKLILCLKALAKKIEAKVYEYGFLKK